MKEPKPLTSFGDEQRTDFARDLHEFKRKIDRIVADSQPASPGRVASFFNDLPASAESVRGLIPVGISSDPRRILLSWSQAWGLVRWMDELASDLAGEDEWGTVSMMEVVALRLWSEYGIGPFVLPLADGSWEARMEHHYGKFSGKDSRVIGDRVKRLCDAVASKIAQHPSVELGVSDLLTRFLTLSRTVDTCDEFSQTSDMEEMEELIQESGDQIQSLLWWAARVVMNPPGSEMKWDAYPWPWEV